MNISKALKHIKYNIDITRKTKRGYGFNTSHRDVVINGSSIIGDNCTINFLLWIGKVLL